MVAVRRVRRFSHAMTPTCANRALVSEWLMRTRASMHAHVKARTNEQ